MPDFINDFSVQELELIAGDAINYEFDVETDDVKVTITDENNNIVIGPNGQFASYFIYNSLFMNKKIRVGGASGFWGTQLLLLHNY